MELIFWWMVGSELPSRYVSGKMLSINGHWRTIPFVVVLVYTWNEIKACMPYVCSYVCSQMSTDETVFLFHDAVYW